MSKTPSSPPPPATKPPPHPDLDPASSKIKSGSGFRYPNPPDPSNPDPSTLREQWRFAVRQYSKWYSHAWGTAILAGAAFFALGWLVKGSNPLPSLYNKHKHHQHEQEQEEQEPATK